MKCHTLQYSFSSSLKLTSNIASTEGIKFLGYSIFIILCKHLLKNANPYFTYICIGNYCIVFIVFFLFCFFMGND